MKLADGADLLPGLTFEHPDDDNAEDQTVARVRLPRPVPPGGSVDLDIVWDAQLPRVFARTGQPAPATASVAPAEGMPQAPQ